jgi:hypothetical protein
MHITFFKNIYETEKNFSVNINTALERIRTGESKKNVLIIRKEKDKDKRNELKKKLPCAVFGGTFENRSKEGLIKSSGFAILDFDDINISYKDVLKQDFYIYACWVSPSGTGLKALIKIPEVNNDKEYKEYYNAILAKYEKANIDKSTKDISRVAYESFDPDIYININSNTFTEKIEEIQNSNIISNINLEKYTDDETYEKLVAWANKTDTYTKGNRNNYLFKLAAACNSFGLNKNNVTSYLCRGFDLKDNEIVNIVNSAYRNTSDFNTKSFESWDILKSAQKELKNRDRSEVKNHLVNNNNISPNQADVIIEKALKAKDRKISTFWDVLDDGKIFFHLEKYINWLEGNGYFRYNIGGGEYILIQINNNIVTEIYRFDIRRFVYDYINKLPFEFDGIFRITLQEWFFKNEKKFISDNIFELLTPKDIDFHKDKKDNALFFFKNTVVKVDKDKLTTFDYSSLESFIWNKQILNREFKTINLKEDIDFEIFLRNIFGDHNLISIFTCIGYLLHQNKSLAFAPAIVLNDKIISDDPNGGTGKGIFAKAISQFKSAVTIDGKSFSFDKSFAFQRVDLSTDLLIFDDVKKGFDFERLFSLITEGLTVEKKNKGEFFIPFADAPKIIITTNYALKGDGNSIERRKIDFELNQHYNKEFTPLDEFKKLFFDDWTTEEWNDFDNFMLSCVSLYLKKGIIKPVNENLSLKRLIANTNDSFIDFMNDYNDFNTYVKKTDFHNDFVKETNLKTVKSNTLTKWVKRYCKFHNFEYNDVSSGGVRSFKIKNNREVEQEVF